MGRAACFASGKNGTSIKEPKWNAKRHMLPWVLRSRELVAASTRRCALSIPPPGCDTQSAPRGHADRHRQASEHNSGGAGGVHALEACGPPPRAHNAPSRQEAARNGIQCEGADKRAGMAVGARPQPLSWAAGCALRQQSATHTSLATCHAQQLLTRLPHSPSVDSTRPERCRAEASHHGAANSQQARGGRTRGRGACAWRPGRARCKGELHVCGVKWGQKTLELPTPT